MKSVHQITSSLSARDTITSTLQVATAVRHVQHFIVIKVHYSIAR